MYTFDTKKDTPLPPGNPEDAARWDAWYYEQYGEIA